MEKLVQLILLLRTKKSSLTPFAQLIAILFALVFLLFSQSTAHAAITYFASASNPADNFNLDLTTVAVSPPGTMQTGDLVVLIANARESGQTLAISSTGGQAWTSETANTTTVSQRIFWARYNGTWSANPSVSFPSAANGTTLVMHVFRPTSGLNTWALDVALTNSSFNAPGGSSDVTIAGVTTVTNGALVLATWVSRDNNTWALQTAGWANAGGAQYRNGDGNDTSQSAAYKVMPTAGASGNVVNRQVSRDPDPGNRSILAFREVAVTTLASGTDPAAATIAPGAVATDVDLFTMQTSSGTEVITTVTVNLSTNSGVGRLAITDNAGTELGFTTSPVAGSNTITVTGMSATTTLTTFRVRVTPLSHAAMPLPAGAAYAITSPVTGWVGAAPPNPVFTHAGSDTSTNALTIDNLSPASATLVSGSAGSTQTVLSWTTSASTDFSRSVILRWAGVTAGTEVPAEGTDYVNGNTITTATVVCVRTADLASAVVSGVDGAGTGGCSATALSNGQAYTYKIFQKDANGNYDVGVAVGTFTPVPAVGGFNTYETTTAAGAIAGVIKTKIAGTSFNLALIALNGTKTAILTTFLGTVRVELLDSSSGGILDANGCNAGWPIIQTLATNPVFAAGDSGLKTVSFQENNAWRNVRVRISFPDTGVATTIGCSSDNFAIRPNSLSFSVTDGDWETAGTTRTLNNATVPGGTVHKAGRPFTITVTGYNGASTPAITTNYAGTPTTSIATHIIPTSCLNGTACSLNGGTFTDGTANDGIVSSATASYAEVGAFNMQLADTSFADIDAGDSTAAERYISSGTVAVGRFVPDHFSLSSGSRTPACTTGGAVLSYMSQPFTLAATLVAQNFAEDTTENYHPSSGGYAPAAVVWQAENADSGTNLTTRLVNVSAAWSNGSYVVNATNATFNRAAAPDGPYDSLQLGTQITDPDGPVLGGLDMNAATSGACAPCTARTVGAPISARFGRLKLSNAYGSELLNLPIPIQAQYWNGVSFVTNTADSCTTLAAGNVNLTAAPAGVVATMGGVFSKGVGSLTLSRPSPAATGAVGVCVDLGADPVGGTVCSATASANLTYMQGLWSPGTSYNNDPGARATFGIYKGNNNFIYQREAY